MTDLTRPEFDAKLAASEAKVDARLAHFDTSIKTGFTELRAEMANMRAEMADMRAEVQKGIADIIKWGILAALGFATATVSILTFVINNVAPKQAAQPVPIVITVPSAASPTAVQAPAPRK
jgi:roadblock/LC7 domain-containing protein